MVVVEEKTAGFLWDVGKSLLGWGDFQATFCINVVPGRILGGERFFRIAKFTEIGVFFFNNNHRPLIFQVPFPLHNSGKTKVAYMVSNTLSWSDSDSFPCEKNLPSCASPREQEVSVLWGKFKMILGGVG